MADTTSVPGANNSNNNDDGPAAAAAAASSSANIPQPMAHPHHPQHAMASSSTMQQQPPQPDLMDDDDSAEEADLQRQLSLGMGPHQGGLGGGHHHHHHPHPAPMMGGPHHHHHPNSSLGGMPVMEHMPTDVGELLRRANSQSVNPPPLATALRNSASRSGAGGGVGNGSGTGTGTSAYGANSSGATSRLALTNGADTAAAGAAAADPAAAEESEFGQVSHGPLRDFHPVSTQRISSSSTAGGSSLPSSMQTSDPNMAAVPNPPTPTGEIKGGSGGGGGGGGGRGGAAAAVAMARSRSIGAPPTSSSSHFPSPLGRPGSLRRNATDESAHRPQSDGPGGRQSSKSTVTFTDDVPDRDDKMKAAAAARSAVSGDGIANNASDITKMSREERDRLLRELLSAQERESSQQQPLETGTPAQQSNNAVASASVPAPSRAAAPGEARAAGGGANSADGSVDSTVAEMIRRQEEAALRLSLAETRGNVASGSEAARAAESARAAMEESDDQMLNRALELSRTETTARRPDAAEAQAGNDDVDDKLQRVLELSRNDVGGRQQQTCDEDEDEEEMMKRALNISLQDTGGRQYIRGGPRSSAVYAPPPNVARGTSMGEGGIPRQTSVGNRTGGRVTVSGAGIEAVNGIYTLSGTCNSVNMYSQKGQWEGKDVMFTLYRCFLDPEAGVEGDLGTPRLWFISIVPPDVKPGTDEDKDFYVARGRVKT